MMMTVLTNEMNQINHEHKIKSYVKETKRVHQPVEPYF